MAYKPRLETDVQRIWDMELAPKRSERRGNEMASMQITRNTNLTRRKILLGAMLSAFLSCASTDAEIPNEEIPDEVAFGDVEAETRRFIEWERAIRLSREQEAIKKAALSPIPAPCCSNNSAYTCCCRCNMALSIWGLAKYMISKQKADAKAVRAKTEAWITYINPNGYSGKACYTRGCARPFREDGCGGMRRSQLVF